ncbi:MAG: hypothetical protein PHZ00_01840, partial [Candidatus Peribacteraceae bacterium]|nr:hypothetical protein [Candidatus Peribacteraceae bacterium]
YCNKSNRKSIKTIEMDLICYKTPTKQHTVTGGGAWGKNVIQRFGLCDVWQVYNIRHTCQIWESFGDFQVIQNGAKANRIARVS